MRKFALFNLYFTDIAEILNRKWYYKLLRQVIQLILLFIRRCLDSQLGRFLPIFKTSIYGHSARDGVNYIVK